MTWYAVLGVLQEQDSPYEWVYVHDAVEADEVTQAESRAVDKAFKRAAKASPDKSYPAAFKSPQDYDLWSETSGWHYWHILTVELTDGLETVYEPSWQCAEDIEEIRMHLSGDTYHDGTPVPHLYLVFGQGGGGEAWWQRFRASSPRDALNTIEDWIEGEPRSNWDGVDWEFEGIYGMVEEVTPGHYRVYDQDAKLIEEVRTAPTSAFDPRDVKTINVHRQAIGGDPLDLSAGWTPQEIADMAENIRKRGRTHNPRIGKLNPELRFRQVKQPGGVGVAAYLGRTRVGHVLALWRSTKWLDSGTTEPLFRDHPEYTPKSKVLIVGKSYLAPEVRGQGNGVPLYEALMETAAREAGEPYIFASEAAWLGSGTSSEAERVWEALARRHPWYPCRHTSHKDDYYNRRCPPVILVGGPSISNPRRAQLKRRLMR